VSRRTETSYKDESPGKLALHNKALGSGADGSMKRPVRTRMLGVEGAGGEKPPASRLA
jgi:hypothetical protein